MEILTLILGLILGALVNLLADSLPEYREPRGFHCPNCSAPRDPRHWLALVQLAAGAWECDYCGQRRNWRALLVESMLPIISLLLYLRDPALAVYLPGIILVTMYVLIMVIDIEHRLILHIVSFPAAILVILLGYLNPDQGLGETIIGGLAGFGFFFFLYVMGAVFNVVMGRLRGSRIDEVAFGFGDVTLAGVIGLTVGWPAVLVALLLGIFIAGAFSLAYILINLLLRKYNPFMPIPYGPFLIAGAFLVYFGGPNILLNLLGR